MNCEQTREHLVEYLYGELPSELASEVEAELDQCPECAAQLAEMRRVHDLVDALPRLDVPAPVHHNILRQARLAAAAQQKTARRSVFAFFGSPAFATAMVVCLVLGVGVLLERRGADLSSQGPEATAPPAPQAAPESEVAAAPEEPALARSERPLNEDFGSNAAMPMGATVPGMEADRPADEPASDDLPQAAQPLAAQPAPATEAPPREVDGTVTATPVVPEVGARAGELPSAPDVVARLEGDAVRERESLGAFADEQEQARAERARRTPSQYQAEQEAEPELARTPRDEEGGRRDRGERGEVPVEPAPEPVRESAAGGDIGTTAEVSGGFGGTSRDSRIEVRGGDAGVAQGAPEDDGENEHLGLQSEEELEGQSAEDVVALLEEEERTRQENRAAAELREQTAASPPPSALSEIVLDAEAEESSTGYMAEVPSGEGEEGVGLEWSGSTEPSGQESVAAAEPDRAFQGMGRAAGSVETGSGGASGEPATATPSAGPGQLEPAPDSPNVQERPLVVVTSPSETSAPVDALDLNQLYVEGLNRYNDGSYRQAIPYFDAFIQNAPRSNDLLALSNFYLGQANFELGDWRAAADNFEQIADPSFEHYVEVRLLLAQSHENAGDLAQAELLYRELLSAGDESVVDAADEGIERIRQRRDEETQNADPMRSRDRSLQYDEGAIDAAEPAESAE